MGMEQADKTGGRVGIGRKGKLNLKKKLGKAVRKEIKKASLFRKEKQKRFIFCRLFWKQRLPA